MTRSVLLAVLGLVVAGEPVGFSRPMVEPAAPPCNVGVAVERTSWLMGTSLRAAVCAPDRGAATASIETMFEAVAETEARLSTWRADSELSRVNGASVSAWTEVAPATAATLRIVQRWSERTGGAFDPAIGTAIDAWDLRGAGTPASAAALSEATRGAPGSRWEVDEREPRVRRLVNVRLDAGGFGKGAGLAAALETAAATGASRVVLDFGGQIAMRSFPSGEEMRAVSLVAHPWYRTIPIARLDLGEASLATTGVSERYVDVAGEGRVGHVLDPKTGRPVGSWGSVTVIADDPLEADILSTALFVMGPEKAADWSRQHPEVGVLIVSVDASEGIHFWSSRGLTRLGTFEPISPQSDEPSE